LNQSARLALFLSVTFQRGASQLSGKQEEGKRLLTRLISQRNPERNLQLQNPKLNKKRKVRSLEAGRACLNLVKQRGMLCPLG
jgi:hypothetical protein